MRTKLVKNLGVLLSLGLVWGGATYSATAQVAVGTSGSPVDAFGVIPPAASWSTKSLGGAAADPETDAGMDTFVNGAGNAAGTIAAQVNNVAGDPPGTLATAQWTSSGYLITRPTGNAVTLLMATLTNVTGGIVNSFHVKYDYTQKLATGVANEAVKGHRVYYNVTGAAGRWVPLGDFGNSAVPTTVQPIDIEVEITATPWTNGTRMYLLFADDNSNPNADGANDIDNFRVTDVVAVLAPMITSQPQTTSVSPGGSVTFNVGAIGGNPLFYFWRKNGTVIPGATGSSHTINNAVVGDSGGYSVIVSNSFGTATSVVATLTVICSTDASIGTQPADQFLDSGGTISLNVGALGTAPYTYQWYRNNAPIGGATGPTYTKANAVPADSGFYYVVVNNCRGVPATSTNVVVSVADAAYTLVPLTNHLWRYENSNTDQGVAWRAVDFNDSEWLSGRGLFAFENLAAINPLINTVLDRTNLTSGGVAIPTDYFRTSFVLTNDPALVTLLASNYFDDGAVVYLNGVEAFRYNMPGGNIAFTTLAIAANPAGEGVFLVSNLPPAFVKGTNYLAVEVHQNSLASSDIAFGMAVLVTFVAPTPLVITNQPQNLTVFETKQAILTLGLQGQPAYYQWYKDGVAVSNGVSNPLVIQVATTNDAGNYYVIATNYINSVTSAVVALTVLPDTNAPVIVEADGTASLTNVLVTFSELILATNATNVANYRITNTLSGALLTIIRATPQNGSNVLLYTSARTAGQNYILVVNNLRDVSPRANLIAPNSSYPVRSLLSVIPFTASYDYYDPYGPPFDNADLGTAWKEFTYDAAGNGFGTGNGIFFDGSDPSIVPGPVGSSLSQTLEVVSYFRNTFNLQASPGGLKLQITHVVDDGAVFYLNGVEFLRFNMPAGTINYQTLPSTTTDPIARVGPLNIPTTSLRVGANVLAAELHQISAAELDKAFGVQLDAAVQSFVVGPVVITGGPEDITVAEGQSATFKVVQAGGLLFQWQSNSVDIAGATSDSYTVPLATLAMNGRLFRVGVSNTVSGKVYSTNATLRVVTDTNAPTVVSAFAQLNNTILLSFNEVMAAGSANNAANYTVTNSAGAAVAVTGAALSNGTNVTLSFGTQLAGQYTVVINNLTDVANVPNTIAPNTTVTVGADYLLSMTGGWKYLLVNTNADVQTNFMKVAYNDSTWQGPSNALLYVEDAALPAPKNTLLTLLDGGGNRINTFYFRQRFVAPASASAVTVNLSHIIDDGMILYLNGTEIFRYNMNAGVPTAASQATAAIGNATLITPGSFVISNLLVGGTNIFAAEVHQSGATSGDVVMGVQIGLSFPSIVIPPCSGAAQITGQPQSRTNTVGSTASFSVAANGTGLAYQWRKNGANIPGANASSYGIAVVQCSDAGAYSVTVSNACGGAVSSTANLTVLGCCVTTNPPSPSLAITRAGTNYVLTWASAPVSTNTCGQTGAFTLQRALYLSNAQATIVWSNVTTVSPYTNGIPRTNSPAPLGAGFFRLRLN